MTSARSALAPLAGIFVALVTAQFYLAGAAAFGATGFDAHVGLGYALVALALALLGLAVAGRELVALTAALVGLMALQVVLAQAGEGSGWIGGLHVIGGLATFAVAGLVGHRAGLRARGVEPR